MKPETNCARNESPPPSLYNLTKKEHKYIDQWLKKHEGKLVRKRRNTMKKLVLAVLILAALGCQSANAEYVNGYVRKDGTYVSGYYRSDRNSTVQDNYSYKGNQNPYTGETGSSLYRKSPSSGYYNTWGNSRTNQKRLLGE